MPYLPPPSRRMPAGKETIAAEFTRADGSREAIGKCTRQTSPDPNGDVDSLVVHHKHELSCGCYFPDAQVGGVCAECAAEQVNPSVCTAHYVVCRCGTPCCWKHSRPTEDGTARICSRCHVRTQNEACKAAVFGVLGRAARRLLFVEPEAPQTQGPQELPRSK